MRAPRRILILAVSFASLFSLGFGQQTTASTRQAEIISYGQSLPGIEVQAGSRTITGNLGLLPPGLTVPLDGVVALRLSRNEMVNGSPRSVPFLEIPIPPDYQNPLVIIIPPVNRGQEKGSYQAKVINQNLQISPGALHIYNLTHVPMAIQPGLETRPLEVGPWGQVHVIPKTDHKHRARVRVAYQHEQHDWNIVKDSTSAFRPAYYSRFRVLLANEGLAQNAATGGPEDRTPFVYLDEQTIPIPGAIAPPPVGEAPEYKHNYQKIDVLSPPGK